MLFRRLSSMLGKWKMMLIRPKYLKVSGLSFIRGCAEMHSQFGEQVSMFKLKKSLIRLLRSKLKMQTRFKKENL